MSDFKEGDLLEHRASGQRCIFLYYRDVEESVSVVVTGLGGEKDACFSFELTKVKEESNG